MADSSPIEWTDATWNPVRGCTRVSPGCGGPGHAGGCYAESVAARFSDPGQPYHGFAERGRPGSKWTGKVALIEDMLEAPLRWRKPRRIFVNSMSDLFHEALPDAAIDKVFAVMALAPQHTFQVLTKRAERMRDYLLAAQGNIWDAIRRVPGTRPNRVVMRAGAPTIQTAPDWPLPNVWLGVSVEDQARADERIPALLHTPAAVRFLSCEPLLGPVDLTCIPSPVVEPDDEGYYHSALERSDIHYRDSDPDVLTGRKITDAVDGPMMERIDWVIAGGESGPRARPAHPDWFRSLRDQCADAGVPFFFKQWGEWLPAMQDDNPALDDWQVNASDEPIRVGKKAAGRLLDGREWNEMPA